jgi:hypothetical protein
MKDQCASALESEDVTPVFVVITTEVAFFELSTITFVLKVSAPKAEHCFSCDYLSCCCYFVECIFKRVPCNRSVNGDWQTLFVGEVFSELMTMYDIGYVVREIGCEFIVSYHY